MSVELSEPLRQWPPFNTRSLDVTIGGQLRTPRFTEGVRFPDSVFYQSRTVGRAIFGIATRLQHLLESPQFRQQLGLDERIYSEQIAPFSKTPTEYGFIGADAVLDRNNLIKIVEINSRPQALGRYDATAPYIIGETDDNAHISPQLKSYLDRFRKADQIGVVLSHPKNAFHNHHVLLGEQLGFPVVAIQDLTTDEEGGVRFKGDPVGVMFRQCNMNALLDPLVTDPMVLSAIKDNKVAMVNGPLSHFLGEKTLLPLLGDLDKTLTPFLPDMVTLATGEELDMSRFRDWWLKGETRGNLEFTLQLNKQNRQGWPGRVIRAVVMGDFSAAEKALEGQSSLTSERFRHYVIDLKKNPPLQWLLQENIEPLKVRVRDDQHGEQSLNTMLRMYFVPCENPETDPYVHLEMLASENTRVSGAGFNVPIKHSITSLPLI